MALSSADNPYVDAQGRTDAELYLMGVLDGSIVSGKRLKQLAEKMLPRIRDGYKQWRFDPDLATRPIEFTERFLKIPSGKLGIPFVLDPYERMVAELIFGFVDENEKRQFQYSLIVMARKNGKALSLDTEIPTPEGWKPMADIHPGDYVFGQDGKPAKVLFESDVFDKPMYLVTFEDGATIKASADHVWTVTTRGGRETFKRRKLQKGANKSKRVYREGGWFEITTAEMAGDVCCVTNTKEGRTYKRCKYRVPSVKPVEYPQKELPVDPYTLGYWLGDGSKKEPMVVVSDKDVDEAVEHISAGGHVCDVRHVDGKQYSQVWIDVNRCGWCKNPFVDALHKLGVFNNKHIPDIYLQGSVEQRWELLRGLMDTDGCCSTRGECEFDQKDEAFVSQFIELCSSLGIGTRLYKSKERISKNGIRSSAGFSVHFTIDKSTPCFKFTRKNSRLKESVSSRMAAKSIVSIERIPNEPSKCIAVDNDTHLYLAGRQYTATHNTSFAAALELYVQLCDGEGAPQIYNAATSKAQASLAYGAVWRMVRQSPELGKYLRKGVVMERAETGIICDGNMSYIVPLSKQSDHLDGLDVHMCVLDEMAAAEDRAIFDLVRQGTGAREQPLFIAITTNGFVRDGLFDSEHQYAYDWLDGKIEDDRFLPILFEQDDRSEVWGGNEELWKKSNPGLGTVKSFEYLRSQVLKAKNDSSFVPTLLTKDFNIPANSASSFLSFEEAVNTTEYEFDPSVFRYGIVGIDAADSIDLNAATVLFMKPGDNHIYRRSMYWIPEEQVRQNSNSMRGRDGGVPYLEYAARGLLRIVPGNHCDKRVFVDWIQELADEGLYTRYVGYDPWHMDDTTLRNMEALVGKQGVEPVRQGVQTLSQPMKELKAMMRDGMIVDNNNSIDHMCNMNVAVKVDINENIQPVKKSGPTSRIDGFMALLDAYIAYQRHRDEYHQIIGWEPAPLSHYEAPPQDVV